METKNVIYLYTNKINGHKYIGQAVDFKSRHSEHKSGKGVVNKSRIDMAFLKYGSDSFEIEILASSPNMEDSEARDYLNALEEYYIWKYDTFKNPDHYNLQPGGHNFGIGENHPHWKKEARIIKGGLHKGKQIYNLRFKGKVLRRSIHREELQRICDELNTRKIDVHSRDERAYVQKCGFTSNGKQNYCIKFKGKIIKTSIFKDKLQKICDEINLQDKWNIPENQLSIIKEAHVVKAGVATGKQRYKIIYDGKSLNTSGNLEELQSLCDEINAKGIEAYYKYQNENSKKDLAVIVKSGINRQGKQKYCVNYNGKSVKNSIDKVKLQKICDEINLIGLDTYLKKENDKKYKATLKEGKNMFYAMYNNQVITASISKEKILNICDYINSNGLEAYNHVKNGARVVKNGFTKEGKQQYGIKYQKKIIQISIYKEKLQKICDEINDENLNKDGF